jgi:hypothetical protein
MRRPWRTTAHPPSLGMCPLLLAPRSMPHHEAWRIRKAYSPECVEGKFSELRLETVRKASEGVYDVALRTAEKALFGPFRHPYSGQVHVRSVAHTPFRTVSEGVFCEVRMAPVQHPCRIGVPNATKRFSKTRLIPSYLLTLRAVAGCATGSTRPNRCPKYGTGF